MRQLSEQFRKSSKSSQCDCVEVALRGTEVRVRESQGGPELRFTRSQWAAFLYGAKNEEFELPLA